MQLSRSVTMMASELLRNGVGRLREVLIGTSFLRESVLLAFEGEDQKWSLGTWNCCSSVPLPSRVDADNSAWSVAVNVTVVVPRA